MVLIIDHWRNKMTKSEWMNEIKREEVRREAGRIQIELSNKRLSELWKSYNEDR